MEYMGDGDLLNYLLKKKEKRLENEEAALAVESVLKALDFLHSRGVTHRDVKIENCLVNLTQNKDKLINCKLSDFGLAALSPQGKSMSASLGTVAYAAPEVILRQKYDRSVDLWGVGCLLYVLLSGKLPFGGTTDKEIANSVTNVKLHFKGEFWDADAVHLIKHLLVRNPKHRYTLAEAKAHQWLVKYRPVNHRL
jgi:serine/threonine/tyrosine protein kinase RAD53